MPLVAAPLVVAALRVLIVDAALRVPVLTDERVGTGAAATATLVDPTSEVGAEAGWGARAGKAESGVSDTDAASFEGVEMLSTAVEALGAAGSLPLGVGVGGVGMGLLLLDAESDAEPASEESALLSE